MEEITIERVGKSDLTFTGELIGQSDGTPSLLRIYRTKSGKYVAVYQKEARRADAEPFEGPAEVVTWVKTKERSTVITSQAQEAIEKAREVDEKFKQFWTQHVE